MNVLLINPWLTVKENLRFYPVEPLGILYVATYSNEKLKNSSYDIKIKVLDAQLEGDTSPIAVEDGFRSGIDNGTLINFLQSFNPEIIGITNNYTPHTKDALEIAGIAKRAIPEAKIIFGGVNASLAHRELITRQEIDIVVRNEGEMTFWEILHLFYEKKNYLDSPGITAKGADGKIIVNPEREFIADLDLIPFPDRSLINYPEYIANERLYFTTKNHPVGTLVSSRGCMFDCIFCSTKTMWRKKWRGRSPQNVVDEIEYLVNSYGVKEIAFQDDQFMAQSQRVSDICREIKKRKLKITFIVPSGISPSLLKEDILLEMIGAGFYRIALSIDSGTEKSRQIANKPLDLSKMRSLVKYLNSKGLWTYATFVIGLPNETKEDILAAIDYAYNLRVDFLRFYVAQPYIGSKLYDIYLEKGLISDNPEKAWDEFSVYNSPVKSCLIHPDELRRLRNSAENLYPIRRLILMFNLRYFFQEVYPKINSRDKLIYFIRLLFQLRRLDKARGFTFQNNTDAQ